MEFRLITQIFFRLEFILFFNTTIFKTYRLNFQLYCLIWDKLKVIAPNPKKIIRKYWLFGTCYAKLLVKMPA